VSSVTRGRKVPAVSSRHDLVVIGASAGGVEALQRVVAGFPPDLAACVCVVLHRSRGSVSALASVLDRAGPLPCRTAVDGEELAPAQILVAPSDHHLVVEHSHVRLTLDPPEHGLRPSVDVLFRSASEAYDGKTVGVVLTGTLDDGTAGLAMIKGGGGGAIVQDPDKAMYPGMPRSAIAGVAVDAVVDLDRVAGLIVEMVNGTDPSQDGAGADHHRAGPIGSTS
jgi:two-component system chemotaxis response regulator CheB